MLLTGALDITVIACNYLQMMGTEHLILGELLTEIQTLVRDQDSPSLPEKGHQFKGGKKPDSRMWYEVDLTAFKTIKYLSELEGVRNACSCVHLTCENNSRRTLTLTSK